MALTHRALLSNAKIPFEHGFGKPRPPGTGVAEAAGKIQRERAVRQHPIGNDRAADIKLRVHPFDLLRSFAAKRWKVFLADSQPCRHRVPTKTNDKIRTASRDRLDQIAHMDARELTYPTP